MDTKKFISELYIYPIKSLPALRRVKSKVLEKGLKYDRRWMLVDENNKFITLRKHKSLYQFNLLEVEDGFVISNEEHVDKLKIPFIINGDYINVKIWDDEVEAVEGNVDWGLWFSKIIGINCKLVYLPEENERPIKKKWQVNNESVSFADGYPYLVVGQSSMDELNSKVGEDLAIIRFRPNIVFKGGEAYEEFLWKDFQVGEVAFKGLKPCVRCAVPTINPATGESGKEPTKTLLTQKIDGKIVFGQHCIALNEGVIKVGDEVELKTTKESPNEPL